MYNILLEKRRKCNVELVKRSWSVWAATSVTILELSLVSRVRFNNGSGIFHSIVSIFLFSFHAKDVCDSSQFSEHCIFLWFALGFLICSNVICWTDNATRKYSCHRLALNSWSLFISHFEMLSFDICWFLYDNFPPFCDRRLRISCTLSFGELAKEVFYHDAWTW